MSTLAVSADTDALKKLIAVMEDYQTLMRTDSSQALAKGARELTFALYQGFRAQPPRPIEGSITAAAAARGWRTNVLSRSYLTGYASALRILGGNKSGYFRLINVNGRFVAQPIVLGRRRNIIRSGRKHFSQRGSLLTSASELNDASTLPGDAVKLNVGSLAVVMAMQLREKAALGGYLALQFLSYKKMSSGGSLSKISRIDVTANDKKVVGEVVPETDNDGKLESVLISAKVPGTLRVAEKYGIVSKSIEAAAKNFRADMNQKVLERIQKLVKGVQSGTHELN